MFTQDFFARLRPEFIEQQGSARVNAERQAQVERLLGKAEYEFGNMRRDLGALLSLAGAPDDEMAAGGADTVAEPDETARAA